MADYDVVEAFKKIEDELVASMIRNLDRHRAEENDLGINWEQWQVKQLAALEQYKRENLKKYKGVFGEINSRIESIIRIQREAGNAGQEISILRAIKEGAKLHKAADGVTAEFLRVNDRKLDALIKATTDDMQKAEYAMLRMTNDQYRKIIFNAQMYANSGAGTYAKAVDMATKDFLKAGINCIEYKNGARHNISNYAEMAIRTANKRAYLAGEGEKRMQWGISTVIMNKRGNPCPKCLPFVGKVLIDDVWSGGTRKDGLYPLMSSAIAAGLYHPRCKDGHTTFFPGISEDPDDKFTRKELENIEEQNREEAKEQYARRQAESYNRLAKYSLDEDNKRIYQARAEEWKEKAAAYDATRNTFSEVYYNKDYDYDLHLDGYPEEVNKGLSEAAREVARLGNDDRCEHMYLVNLASGGLDYYETNGQYSEVGYYFWKELNEHPGNRYAFVHNHNTDGMFSEIDMQTLMGTEQIPVMIAVRNDAIKYVAERKGEALESVLFDDLYKEEMAELNKKVKDGIVSLAERSTEREKMIVYNILRDYTKGGQLVEFNGQKK